MEYVFSLLIPLLGTTLGAACVFFLKKDMSPKLQKAFSGFAAGIMVAAAIGSLIIPAFEQSQHMGKWAFVPVVIGIWIGFMFLMLLDKVTPHLHINSTKGEGPRNSLKKSTMMGLAIALHNLPEGMAVGVALAGAGNESANISFAMAFVLALGIAIQNFPEGAIVSLPLKNSGLSKGKSFLYAFLTGIVEPIGAILTMMLASIVTPALPYFLSFAAGAMLYVVVEELIPEMNEVEAEANDGNHSHLGIFCFMVGFTLMIALDTLLG